MKLLPYFSIYFFILISKAVSASHVEKRQSIFSDEHFEHNVHAINFAILFSTT